MRKSWLLVAAVFPLAGCGGETTGPGGGEETPVLTTIEVTASKSQIAVNEQVQLSAVAKDQKGQTMSGVTFTWASGNAALAAVDANGLVTGKGSGSTAITASASGKSGSFNLTVQGSQHSANITANETWKAADNPHLVQADIAVNGTGSPILTIEAGVEVRFASGAGLSIGCSDAGAIKVMGTATAPVQFVANTASPTKGFWRQLLIYNKAAASELHYLTLSYCGGNSGLGTDACLSLVGSGNGNGPKPVVDNVTVQNSGAYGVRVDDDAGFGTGSTKLTVTGSTSNPITIEANEAGVFPPVGPSRATRPTRSASPAKTWLRPRRGPTLAFRTR